MQLQGTEIVVKGFAHRRRIQILKLLERKGNLSIFDISNELKTDFRTVSHHTKLLASAGLITKHADFRMVRHVLTPRGRAILTFLRTLE